MTEEERQLLLKDLCARLPYGVKICVDDYICTLLDINTEMGDKSNGETFHTVGFNKPDGNYTFCGMTKVKPYLRSMSSMTEEEHKEYVKIIIKSQDCSYANNESATTMANDWYLSKGFDVRGLIPKDLALEAPEGMYKTE